MSGQNRFGKLILAEKKKTTFAMSRRRRAIIVALCLLFFCLLVWLDHSDITLRSQPEKQSAEELKSQDFKKYHAGTFTVINVVDGDTFDIDISDGDLDAERKSRGYYGRLLAYVKLTDGRFLNEVLLSEGYAYADVRFKHSLYHKYQQLEAVARGRKKGLWENVTREQLPQWMQKRKPEFLLEK
jgi:hypothetical protein